MGRGSRGWEGEQKREGGKREKERGEEGGREEEEEKGEGRAFEFTLCYLVNQFGIQIQIPWSPI